MSKLPPATSFTHRHIATVINTLSKDIAAGSTVRILDLGCGNGRMISYFLAALPILRPDLVFDIYGLDVSDSGVQETGFENATRDRLQQSWPGLDWSDRIRMVSSRDAWPFPPAHFDFVVSNQVFEHVADMPHTLAQLKKHLKPDGKSVNLFPVFECLIEGHAKMPIVHQIRDVERREAWMLRFARMGLDTHYKRDQQRYGWKSHEEFAHVFSRVLETDTHYLRTSEFRKLARAAGLGLSLSYTKDFYIGKLLSVLGVQAHRYRRTPLDGIAHWFAKHFSSSTLVFRNGR